MIIGISGKIGSGKDTVGLMIKYLTCPLAKNKTFQEWYNDGFSSSDWEIKKFAGKLKDIVCLLIGCTREQLEDADFKNKELGEEWWFYTVGLSVFPYHADYKKHDSEATISKLTPRLLLQLIGTNCMRELIHPNSWVNALFADYTSEDDYKLRNYKLFQGQEISKEDITQKYPNWIITDMRFPNEKEVIDKHGGITIRISRGEPKQDEHESETALDNNQRWDYGIQNDGSIEELFEAVRGVLIDARII